MSNSQKARTTGSDYIMPRFTTATALFYQRLRLILQTNWRRNYSAGLLCATTASASYPNFMRAIITGSNAGLGFHTAVALSKTNLEVVLAVRSEGRGEAAAKLIRAVNPAAEIEVAHLDLSSLESVRRFVVGQQGKPWDVLVNNAGAKIERPYKQTEDGFEWHTGVNHLGHFALTAGLWASRGVSAKVVTVSSVVANKAQLNEASTSLATFQEGRAYADSKLLNLLFAANLARLIDMAGLQASSVAAHPGFARAEPYGTKLTRLAELALAQNARRGAESIIQAVSRSNFDYLAPRFLQLWGKPANIMWPSRALDLELMEKCWSEAELATGILFRV